MEFWAEAKRLSYVTPEERFLAVVSALGLKVPATTTPDSFRDVYRDAVCDGGWPKAFLLLAPNKVEEGLVVKSLSGTIQGRTTGNRMKCPATSSCCEGWLIEIVWETGQLMRLCSEGWHYDPETKSISIIGGGEISARFVTPRPLGTDPAPKKEWPSKKDLNKMRGWRVNPWVKQ